MSSEQKKKLVIVIAGKSKSGKSTALNNIFGTDFEAKCSPGSVTKSVKVRCMERDGCELIVVDTVGLAATDINQHQVQKELLDAVGGLNFLLLYCFSINPLNCLGEDDENIVKNLTKILGKDIWNKCLLLFTGCDIVRTFSYKTEDQREQYKKYFDDYANRFSKLLSKTCGDNLQVKSVFKGDIKAIKPEEIVAVPMGLELEQTSEVHDLTPGIEIDWKALTAALVLTKAKSMDREVYKGFMDSSILKKILQSGAVAAGLFVGLGLGGTRGAAAALLGAAAIASTTVFKKKSDPAESKIERLLQAGQRNLENPNLPEEPDLVQGEDDSSVNPEEPDLSTY